MVLDEASADPPFLLRPGPSDYVLLDRLLTRDLFCAPVEIDGLVIEGSLTSTYADLRPKVPASAKVIVDPQVYRLQRESFRDQPSITNLSYAPREGTYTPADFKDPVFVARFVRQVLDEQQNLAVTSFVAPSFYVEDLSSAWSEVNQTLLSEARKQAGARVYATLCGSFAGLCQLAKPEAVSQCLSRFSVEGVLVLLSPICAVTDSPTKLSKFLRLLQTLRVTFGSVVACRQPAFGLGLVALGVAGFDSGISAGERFDYAALTRPKPRPEERDGDKKQGGRARKTSIYLSQLLSRVPYAIAEKVFSTPGVAGSFVCQEPCCRHNSSNALNHSREHFVYTRLKELAQLRSKPTAWRSDHFGQSLIASRQMAQKLENTFRDSPLPDFRHLDVWSRVLADISQESVARP